MISPSSGLRGRRHGPVPVRPILLGARLMDLGARVIKIERPMAVTCRDVFISATRKSAVTRPIFHAISRAKESLAIDLKNE